MKEKFIEMCIDLKKSQTLLNSSSLVVGEFMTLILTIFPLIILFIINFMYCIFAVSKVAAQFHSMEVHNSYFGAYIDVFTQNTYIMVIVSSPKIRKFFHIIHVWYCSDIVFLTLLKNYMIFSYFYSFSCVKNKY